MSKPSCKSAYTPHKLANTLKIFDAVALNHNKTKSFTYIDVTSGLGEWPSNDNLQISKGSPIIAIETLKRRGLIDTSKIWLYDEDEEAIRTLRSNLVKYGHYDLVAKNLSMDVAEADFVSRMAKSRLALNNQDFYTDEGLIYCDPGGGTPFDALVELSEAYPAMNVLLHYSATTTKRTSARFNKTNGIKAYIAGLAKTHNYISANSYDGKQWVFILSSNRPAPKRLTRTISPVLYDLNSPEGQMYLTRISQTNV